MSFNRTDWHNCMISWIDRDKWGEYESSSDDDSEDDDKDGDDKEEDDQESDEEDDRDNRHDGELEINFEGGLWSVRYYMILKFNIFRRR